jgi:hypothetical protein
MPSSLLGPVVALAFCLGLLACSKPSDSAPSSETPTAPAAKTPTVPAAPSADSVVTDTPTESDIKTAGGLKFRAPKPFVSRRPKSPMRAAEFGLVTDSDGPSELAVFYFGADQGGSVDANVTRWVGQFKKPDGSEVEVKRSERSVKDVPVALVETSGSYNGGMGVPGGPAPAAIEDAMLLGAIAKGPQGAVFFKFVGPRAQVESAREGFNALIDSLQH